MRLFEEIIKLLNRESDSFSVDLADNTVEDYEVAKVLSLLLGYVDLTEEQKKVATSALVNAGLYGRYGDDDDAHEWQGGEVAICCARTIEELGTKEQAAEEIKEAFAREREINLAEVSLYHLLFPPPGQPLF